MAAGKSVIVLGAGVAGLATALHLARGGHAVTLIERDRVEVGEPGEAPSWKRGGIPHFLQPHAFIPRGRAELRHHLPDVYASLLEAGARDVDVRRKLPGTPGPHDEDLQYLAVRRPVLEWGLRKAVHEEPGIDVRGGVDVTGLRLEGGRVRGADVDGTSVDAELVVDAMGRRTPTLRWLGEAGASVDDRETSDCGVVYYCRYYRFRPGSALSEEGPWLLSPRGDLGYLGYASFPGDNDTFALLLAVPTGAREWRALHDPAVFEAALARIPVFDLWRDPAAVEPITDVLPMAGLHNTLRHYGASSPIGLVPVGDAYAHTDPVLAHGLSFALVHARELATALAEHDDLVDVASAFAARAAPALAERYAFATALDDQRLRLWKGEHVDFAHHDGAYALFSLVAAGAVAMVDPDVFRLFVRRMGLLDSTVVLDDDLEMRRRIEEKFAALLAAPRPPSGPTKHEMLALIGEVRRREGARTA